MKYNEIIISEDEKYFLYKNKVLFNKKFIQVLKFHSEKLAPVCDESGWYHINMQGKPIYKERYDRVFGYYFEKAAVVKNDKWFHINTKGNKIYKNNFAWCGNYQENLCVVREFKNKYFHIDKFGNEIYSKKYRYTGDFKDGFAVVKLENGLCKHIDRQGNDLNGKFFVDLGVFHKSYATARDKQGWFHIDKNGTPLYNERYLMIEPFYNGFSIIETFDNNKYIINELGKKIIEV